MNKDRNNDGPFTSLKILNLDWSVTWVPKNISSGTEKFAWADLRNQALFIEESLSSGKSRESILHEILHALYWVFDLKDKEKEERVISCLSTGLLSIFRDNPKFALWLVDKSPIGGNQP